MCSYKKGTHQLKHNLKILGLNQMLGVLLSSRNILMILLKKNKTKGFNQMPIENQNISYMLIITVQATPYKPILK
jgi:hypothetical protein